ncbi:M48 family metallopeptidase [Shimia haliotis]|uniref:YgjP-like metallopeptidase domain-containing protein n=1 Tax=Shimia haliotis TaxID=1280847 RepID=A0A1I4FIA4_9RHOB|nr:SprT family zinc-dependent metalloprotease [Shimia haliotis]SFL16657.1 hypothetical protein SAMN04488036_10612 [Shimia haliotis]
MSQHILPTNPPVTVILRHSGRARRISLRVSRLDGTVSLTVPKGVRDREALGFAEEKSGWILAQLAKQPDLVQVEHGTKVPVGGRLREVVAGAGRSVLLGQDEIAVPGDPARAAARVQGFLRELARNRLAEAVDHYAGQLGRSPSKITLRDTRSRWGSCSSAGALMFSWRLVMAPSEILDYVAAHEVAHLQEMNHSQAFWDQVERIHGDYRTQRKWLRVQGQELHRYRFA